MNVKAPDPEAERRVGPRCVFFGPTPPPYSGMEIYTRTALALVRDLPPFSEVVHVDTRVNTSRETRGRFQFRKLVLLLLQFTQAVIHAAGPTVAYYPISQNRIGVARDLVLLAPFRLLRRPIVLHLHGSALGGEVLPALPSWLQAGLRWICRPRTTTGICLTAGLRGAFGELLPSDRVAVLENVVARASLPVVPISRPSEERRLRLLFIGSLIPGKGYRELMEAVARSRDRGHDVTLTLAGAPGSAEDGRWVKERSDGSAIDWVGLVDGDDKWKLIDAHDVLVVPSVHHPEGQPLVILEAFSRARPVIATDLGGIPDTVRDGAGSVVGALPAATLSSRLEDEFERWLHDGSTLEHRSRNAHRVFESFYAPESFQRRWQRVLTEAIRSEKRSRRRA